MNDDNATPALVSELIEPILILVVRLNARPSAVPNGDRTVPLAPRAQTPNTSLMTAPVFVAFSLDPVAKMLLPLLAHAWPLTTPAAHGRVDVLEKARLLRLIPAQPDDGSAVLGIATSAVHRDAGHVPVLQWVARHWPKAIATNVGTARTAVMRAGFWADRELRGIDMLEFWTNQATPDASEARKMLHEAIFATPVLRAALECAFMAKNTAVIRWWAEHAHFNWEVGAHWDWNWVDHALVNGWLSVVRVCADLEAEGKVRFLKGEGDTILPGAYSNVRALDQDGKALMGISVELADTIMDRASELGHVEILRFWKQRHGKSAVSLAYSESAMDLAPTPDVLQWWMDESGLPVKYSRRAIQHATAKGNTRVLDWWLHMFRSQRIPELKYDGWIMTIASVCCEFNSETGAVTGICKEDKLHLGRRIAVLNWWDQSGLDLKLPGEPSLQASSSPSPSSSLEQSRPANTVPSPIDLCTLPSVLTWWLTRARQLLAQHPTTSLQSHFPYYSCTAIHRAAYLGSTRALEWWFRTGGALAGLDLRYIPYRPIELATMAGMASFPSALDWWFSSMPIKFRGSLLEWAKLRPASTPPGATAPTTRDWELERLKGLCMRYRVKIEDGGGLPPPEGGYVKQEVGEEFVFFPLVP